ncbi:MAG: hypothetical protein AAF518_20785 [Spirochaetota bacterium]
MKIVCLGLFLFSAIGLVAQAVEIGEIVDSMQQVTNEEATPLTEGQKVFAGDKLLTEPDASCTVKFKDTEATLTLKGNAKVQFTDKGFEVLAVASGQGDVYYQGEGGGQKIFKAGAVEAYNLGTTFGINLKKNGSVRIFVMKGSVNSKMRIEDVEEFGEETIAKSRVLQKLQKDLDKQKVEVKEGDYIEISRAKVDRFLEKTGLRKTLQEAKQQKNPAGAIDAAYSDAKYQSVIAPAIATELQFKSQSSRRGHEDSQIRDFAAGLSVTENDSQKQFQLEMQLLKARLKRIVAHVKQVSTKARENVEKLKKQN